MPSTGRSVVTYGAPLLLLGGASLVCWLALGGTQTPLGPMRLTPLPPPTPVSSAQSDPARPPPTILEAISPQQAELKNALLPYSQGPLLSGAAYHASADARSSASECMTAAIYYEAAREPDAGKRAIAQVILNRASSPAFPHDVCGVVRQGANRPGCQFTFMCDGSLDRRPDPTLWARAHEIAEQALDGAVDASVGSATHYHADYVYPTWALQMEKLVKIGRHIFYRWRGATLSPPPAVDAGMVPPESSQAMAEAAHPSNLPSPASEHASTVAASEVIAPLPAAPATQKAEAANQGSAAATDNKGPMPLAKMRSERSESDVDTRPHYLPHRAIPESRLEIQPR